MDFLEDLFENLFEGRKKRGWGGGHHGGSGHHGRRGYPGGGYQACPQCGAENNPGSKFCAACGGRLSYEDQSQVPLTCNQCGAPNQPGASFCMNCGARLQATAPSACPACGTPLPPAARFCPRCGQEVPAG